MVELKPGEAILRFRYLERNVSEALVSQLSRKFDLDLNIIFGSIELIGENPIGGLVVICPGNIGQYQSGNSISEGQECRSGGDSGWSNCLINGCRMSWTGRMFLSRAFRNLYHGGLVRSYIICGWFISGSSDYGNEAGKYSGTPAGLSDYR